MTRLLHGFECCRGSKCEGIALLSVLSEKYPEVLGAQMHDVNLAVVAEVKNLRSQVAKEAIKLMRTLFKNLDRRMDLVNLFVIF